MAAQIKGDEVAFPFGEDIKMSVKSCVINPEKKDRKPTEGGTITIVLEYEDATVESSDPTVRPLNRLFSVCNAKDDQVIFTKIIGCTARFTTNPNRTPTKDGIGPKDLSIIIEGDGEKKNSMS